MYESTKNYKSTNMKNKSSSQILIIILAIVLIAGGWLTLNKQKSPATTHSANSNQHEITDEFTGSWRGGGTNKDGYKWFVVYKFKNNTYDMITDSAMKDHGTYIISKRFLDGSVQMTKTSDVFKKTYDVFNTFADNGNTLIIDGMKLKKQP